MAAPEEQLSTLRITLLASVVVLFLLALVSRLWFLQILAGQRFDELSQDQALRVIYTQAPRGRILAADGEPLVDNRRSPTVVVDRQLLLDLDYQPKDETAERVIEDLAQMLGTDVATIQDRLATRRYSPFSAVPVFEDVPTEVGFYIREHQQYFPGVSVTDLPVRTYPQGTTAAHLLGYTSEISPEELADPRFAGYRQGRQVGKAGLEKTYELDLQGLEGADSLSVSATGTVLEVLASAAPRRGHDLVTSVDLDLQRATEAILEAGIIRSRDIVRSDGRNLESVAGSAVVMDVTDGGIVAMASWPTFDPAVFADGLTQDEFLAVFDRAVSDEVPALNRAIQGAYPPGSVFKIVSGAAAMDAGLISPSSRVACPSAWQLGSITFNNWNSRSEGAMDLSTALKRSCDTFFYELAFQRYVTEERELDRANETTEQLERMANAFGMGRTLGIDLPGEAAGVIPSRSWKEDYWERTKANNCALADRAEAAVQGGDGSQRYALQLYTELCLDGYRFRGGDAVNASIGQGDVLTTPLQVAAAYAAVANGGTLFEPHVGDHVVDANGDLVRTVEPVVLGELPIGDEVLTELRDGLERVVMEPGGTGRGAFSEFPLDEVPVAGKTGTAELGSQIPYAWFAAYAPADDPRYAVVVSVERGGGGSQTAAPIAMRILQAAFGYEVTPFVPGEEILD